ncbi:SAV_6107 family HEPN domain-containing protein [Blastococcus sp. URHD0036]|uniref:SAV_6107 family HEPN domain-containing protein n=1 Tax=Blastococcus sp. URHD0036 TaxID=1380356 RepID=UPI000A75620B|nr:SAV_6107 family HEPN domain-containing protein [Blastococcus sp. URHD0036]
MPYDRPSYERLAYDRSDGQLPLPPPVPAAAAGLLDQARRGLIEAAAATDPRERYATAHLAALRGAAAMLAARTRPESGRRRPRSAWVLLGEVAPEMGEWATFFAAGAAKRAAAEAGLSHAVTEREADDLVRDVEAFLGVLETGLTQLPEPAPRPRVVGGTAHRGGVSGSGTRPRR